MITFAVAYLLWYTNAGLGWWFAWIIVAMINLLYTLTKLR